MRIHKFLKHNEEIKCMKKISFIISYLGHLSVVLTASLVLCIYLEPLFKLVGFCPSINSNLFSFWLSLGMIIVAVEILFRSLLQILFASPFNQTNLIESISFLPFILFFAGDSLLSHLNINLPPLPKSFVILSLVMGLHLGMKLLSIFSAIFGKPDSRLLSLPWLIPFLISLYISIIATINLNNAIFTERFFLASKKLINTNGKSISNEIKEGGFFTTQINQVNCDEFILNLKPVHISSDSDIYIYILSLTNREFPVHRIQLTIYSTSEWQEVSIPCDLIISYDTLIITWSTYKIPKWLVKRGLIPTLSFTSYLELKSFVFNPEPYKTLNRKSLLLLGPYEVVDCEK